MLLKLYDLKHTLIGGLKNCKDAKVESVLSTGDKTLSFLWHQNNKQRIPHEYYVRTDKDEYVVKENSKSSKGYRSIVANLNLEDLEGRAWMEYTIKERTAQEAADYALTDTGWTCVSTVTTERIRNISMKKTDSLKIIGKILEAYTCEVAYDTLNKIVYLKERVGSNKGTYFIKGLNLKEVRETGDTYDYATRIIPIGADGIEITDVNDGKNYLENYQYSGKIKTVIWEDSNYTDKQALKEDAEYRLNEISKPKRSYSISIIDLARVRPEYSILSYSVGDTVTLIDNEDGVNEKQRITKTVEYLNHPEKNTCEVANTVLSFEEMQKKLFAAAECIDNITTDNGTVNGSKVDAIDVTQIIGLERYIAEDIDDLKVNTLYVRSEFGAANAAIGELTTTAATTTRLNVTSREDSPLSYITELHADVTYGNYAKYTTVESDNISALEERVNNFVANNITTEYLQANYAQINFENVNTANIKQGFLEKLMVSQGVIADRISAGEIVATNVLTGVNIYADDITAGTLSVDRLVLRGTDKSLVYALNNSGTLVSASVDTLDAYILTDRTITGDKIVAKTITAEQIDVTDLVATGLIESNKLTAQNIAAGAITTTQMAAGAVTATKIAAGTITATQIAAETITAAKIAANAITADKIDVANLFAQDITASGVIRSSNYVPESTGMELRLSTGEWDSKYLKITDAGISATGEFSTIATPYNGVEHTCQMSGYGIYIESVYSKNGLTTDELEISPDRIWMKEGGVKSDVRRKIRIEPYMIEFDYGDTTVGSIGVFDEKKLVIFGSINVADRITTGACDTPGYTICTDAIKCISLSVGTNANTAYTLSTDTADISKRLSVGAYENASYALSTATFICNSWVRTVGVSGWYNETYGGGWYMADTTYIRSYLNKHVLIQGNLYIGSASYYITSAGAAKFASVTSGYMGMSTNTIESSTDTLKVKNSKNIVALANTAFRPSANDAGKVTLGNSSVRWGQIYTTKAVSVSSDKRVKNSIEDLDERYMSFICSVNANRYRLNDEAGGCYHIGFVAQDVEQVLLQKGIGINEFAGLQVSDGTYAICYEEFIPLLTLLGQKLNNKVDQQERRLQYAEDRINALQAELMELKQAVA